MYEGIEFCHFCGRKLVQRLTKEVRYSHKTGKPDSRRWTLFCPATVGLLGFLEGEHTNHERRHWWEVIDA